jgi:hypothetical protein
VLGALEQSGLSCVRSITDFHARRVAVSASMKMLPGDLLVIRNVGEPWGTHVGDPSSTRGPPILTPRRSGLVRQSVRLDPGTPLLMVGEHGSFAIVLHEGAEHLVEKTWVRRA